MMPPMDLFWGDRYTVVTCPSGHIWSFSMRVANPTDEEIAAASQAMFGGGGVGCE
jgi:PhnB protein